MGNNKKKSKKSNSTNKTIVVPSVCIPSVSIITITQFKRFECLKILFDLIKSQTYTNIIEWVIVEGSKSDQDILDNSKNILGFIDQVYKCVCESGSECKCICECSQIKFKIIYVEKKSNVKLGELRNIGNKTSSGDIMVCMDDDDYYPIDRVEHAVKKLSQSNMLIAGCSGHLMYDYDFNILVQMKTFGPYHSINSCMAWKKNYLLTNSHDPEKEFGEEQSFTKNFTEPMVQLDPFSSVILSSHTSNTYSKKIFFLAHLNQYKNNIEKIINEPIDKYIPNQLYSKYKNCFIPIIDNEPRYDIVYMCGAFSILWNPENKKLGGSEQAVVNLSENWVKMNKSVIVYGEVPDTKLNGVVYKHWTKFNFNPNYKYKNLILWRNYGLSTIIPFQTPISTQSQEQSQLELVSHLNIKAEFTVVDVHDNFIGQCANIFKKYYKNCDKIFLKSNYHKECLLNNIDSSLEQNNIVIIPNGIRVNKFNIQPEGIQRNLYRFCYCSCYTRGLDKIISVLWKIIYNYEPRAELHVYYGMDLIKDPNHINYLRTLLGQPGVMDHGRQPMEIIIREKYLSTFHFYITNTEVEIDCISIRESLVAGCIPLLSNFGVFKERRGLHFDFNTDKEINMCAINIINLLNNPKKVDEIREQIKTDSTIIDWETIALEWNKHFID